MKNWHEKELMDNNKSEIKVRMRRNGSEQCGELLRRQSVFELHTRHVVVQRHGNHLLHGADEAVLLAAILDHQRVWLVRVKHDIVGGHNQDTANHTLKTSRKAFSPTETQTRAKENNFFHSISDNILFFLELKINNYYCSTVLFSLRQQFIFS